MQLTIASEKVMAEQAKQLTQRSLEPSDTRTHRIFLNSNQMQRIYLDELGTPNTLSPFL